MGGGYFIYSDEQFIKDLCRKFGKKRLIGRGGPIWE
jgi:hypothetical protein